MYLEPLVHLHTHDTSALCVGGSSVPRATSTCTYVATAIRTLSCHLMHYSVQSLLVSLLLCVCVYVCMCAECYEDAAAVQ